MVGVHDVDARFVDWFERIESVAIEVKRREVALAKNEEDAV